jgi:glycosyltransferase involved in cell wall biosynthesis
VHGIKVCMLTSVHPAYDVRIYEREARTLAAEGYAVTIVAPHERNEHSGNVQVKAVRVAQDRRHRMTFTVWEVYEAARELDADVYHFHDPELIPIGMLLKLSGKCVVYDAHEDVPRDILQKEWIPAPLRRILAGGAAAAEALASLVLDRTVAATPVIAAKFSPRKTTAIQNFPPLQHARETKDPPYHQRENRAVYIGGIELRRGAREMVLAMSSILDDRTAHLCLAGMFDPPELELELQTLPGAEKVRMCGWLSRERVLDLLGSARLGLVTLQPIRTFVDSQPIKLFEYMCAGIPVVASDFPLWRKIVEGTGCGLLVNPREPAAIGRAIEWVFRHPVEAEEMGQRGAAAVRAKFNWTTEGKKLLDLYSELAT